MSSGRCGGNNLIKKQIDLSAAIIVVLSRFTCRPFRARQFYANFRPQPINKREQLWLSSLLLFILLLSFGRPEAASSSGIGRGGSLPGPVETAQCGARRSLSSHFELFITIILSNGRKLSSNYIDPARASSRKKVSFHQKSARARTQNAANCLPPAEAVLGSSGRSTI